MTESPIRFGWGKRILLVTGFALLSCAAYIAFSIATGEDRLTEVCSQMKPGMTTEQLMNLAKERGLGPRNLDSGMKLTYLAEARSFGRHACKVELDAGIVRSATYNYAD